MKNYWHCSVTLYYCWFIVHYTWIPSYFSFFLNFFWTALKRNLNSGCSGCELTFPLGLMCFLLGVTASVSQPFLSSTPLLLHFDSAAERLQPSLHSPGGFMNNLIWGLERSLSGGGGGTCLISPPPIISVMTYLDFRGVRRRRRLRRTAAKKNPLFFNFFKSAYYFFFHSFFLFFVFFFKINAFCVPLPFLSTTCT